MILFLVLFKAHSAVLLSFFFEARSADLPTSSREAALFYLPSFPFETRSVVLYRFLPRPAGCFLRGVGFGVSGGTR